MAREEGRVDQKQVGTHFAGSPLHAALSSLFSSPSLLSFPPLPSLFPSPSLLSFPPSRLSFLPPLFSLFSSLFSSFDPSPFLLFLQLPAHSLPDQLLNLVIPLSRSHILPSSIRIPLFEIAASLTPLSTDGLLSSHAVKLGALFEWVQGRDVREALCRLFRRIYGEGDEKDEEGVEGKERGKGKGMVMTKKRKVVDQERGGDLSVLASILSDLNAYSPNVLSFFLSLLSFSPSSSLTISLLMLTITTCVSLPSPFSLLLSPLPLNK